MENPNIIGIPSESAFISETKVRMNTRQVGGYFRDLETASLVFPKDFLVSTLYSPRSVVNRITSISESAAINKSKSTASQFRIE